MDHNHNQNHSHTQNQSHSHSHTLSHSNPNSYLQTLSRSLGTPPASPPTQMLLDHQQQQQQQQQQHDTIPLTQPQHDFFTSQHSQGASSDLKSFGSSSSLNMTGSGGARSLSSQAGLYTRSFSGVPKQNKETSINPTPARVGLGKSSSFPNHLHGPQSMNMREMYQHYQQQQSPLAQLQGSPQYPQINPPQNLGAQNFSNPNSPQIVRNYRGININNIPNNGQNNNQNNGNNGQPHSGGYPRFGFP
eukprot:TRINITY_DN1423_c0_g2_i1.p1 TRINITY_DN1423_c0_g2~~TRINITY_DN1423_c0_g2_i1.p1  ORF type:complete len:246 (-),score=65.53 TRINITY_DN1423_c0_g2_i1:165-902(-)